MYVGPIGILLIVMLFILILTARLRIHPFISLIAGSVLAGFLADEVGATLETIVTGMSSIFADYAIIVTSGSIIGVILHKSGATALIADDVTKLFRKPVFAIALLGFAFAVPMMCLILAFIIFLPVAKDLSDKHGFPKGLTEVALALATMASFGLLYPSPGIYAFVNEMNIQVLDVLFIGVAIALVVFFVGYIYASRYYGFSIKEDCCDNMVQEKKQTELFTYRTTSYIPIIVPIILIMIRLLTNIPVIELVGHESIALLAGAILAMTLSTRHFPYSDIRAWVDKGIRRSGLVLLDICGGGALGAMLVLAGVGDALGDILLESSIPALLVPFLIAAAVQTVQGSRMVTLFTASALVIPIMPQLGLPAVIVLFSMASGTFLISHFNDPYFWILADFAEMESTEVLKTYTVAGAVMGLSSMAMTSVIYFVFY
ncbi:GntP family permease [Methanolobus halotolerans]|uniref:Gluconate permease n=1 Tax=Methanolobus halotolerans TaxID=2052935 RepID=A0A4E0Q6Z0_9EURY|nr:GntP family permease [Methanolobus halotolerans]TGC10657.1 gluconate permease [Methanolobus halotolerans]